MRVGVGPGPAGASDSRSSVYVYDTRSGSIVSAHHFAGEARVADDGWLAELVQASHEANGIPLEHLAALASPDHPDVDGRVRVADDGSGLVRAEGDDLRVLP